MTVKSMVQVLPPDICRGHEPLIGARVMLYNYRLRKRRLACGFTQYALADSIGVSQSRITEIETFKRAPSMSEMEQIATALYDEASRLFPEEIRNLKMQAPVSGFYLTHDGGLATVERDMGGNAVQKLLDVVSPRERVVIESRFGMITGQPHTMGIIAREQGVTRERVRQIEAQALEKIRRAAYHRRGDFLGLNDVLPGVVPREKLEPIPVLAARARA